MSLALVAFVGPDEFGSGKVGLKQARTPSGFIPLAAIEEHREKLEASVLSQLQAQADRYNVTIRLVRFVEAETLLELRPRPQG